MPETQPRQPGQPSQLAQQTCNGMTQATKAAYEERCFALECRLLGEEQARINRLPEAQFLAWIDQAQREADTPSDLVWPAEGYTGPQLP